MKNTVLLINAPQGANYWDNRDEPGLGIPIGLLSIASNLKANGFKPVIVDGMLDRDYMKRIEKELENQELLWIGLSSMTSGLGAAKNVSTLARAKRPDLFIVWGGFHSTLFPESVVSSSLADAAVFGDGEVPAVEISRRLAAGRMDFDGVGQVAYKGKDGNVVPCCRDPKGKNIMGNILEQDMDEIWNGEKFRSFRSQLLRDKESLEICGLCSGFGVSRIL
ncbi:MAG: cobalamin-dependent protein [Nitrospinota bacterium]|nr:cobalamin-dependent protein [Nitrospinota bacterium]